LLLLIGAVSANQHISVTDRAVNTGSTGTIILTLDQAPHGLSGFKISLAVDNPSVAEITSVTYPPGFQFQDTTKVPFTTGIIKAADVYATFVTNGSSSIPLATVTIRGLAPGSTTLRPTILKINANYPMSDDYVPTTTIDAATISVSSQTAAPVAVGGSGNLPADPDHDGLYEDLDGDGTVSFSDVTLFFYNMDWIANNEPLALFDYNSNGAIDFPDIIRLNQEV